MKMSWHKCWITVGLLCCFQFLVAAEKCQLKSKSGNTKFPPNLKFGVSTGAYQIEGGWNADGKGPSLWDNFTHTYPYKIDEGANGDVADDSYHRFDQDLAALKGLGVQTYRFSIAWSRIFPNGDISSLNSKGIDYYNMIIDKLLDNNIEPLVTIYHFNMPTELQKFGGLANPLFIRYYKVFAETLFKNFGDRVKYWMTFNEPNDFCIAGYGDGVFAPGVMGPGVIDYLCADVTLKAHAVVYHLYKRKFKHQGGKIGISINSRFLYSKDDDDEAVNRALQFTLGWLGHPIFSKSGNYPRVMLDTVRKNSKEEGRAWSRLEPLDDYWEEYVKGSADFLSLNYYTSNYVEWAKPPLARRPSWDYDFALQYTEDPNWKRAKSAWLYCVPQGFEDLLRWIRDNYNNVEVLVTENGWSDGGLLNDQGRVEYIKSHLQALVNAIDDGCNVSHYAYWSLIDNFEWTRGYTENFGLYSLNRTSSNLDRIPKSSVDYYRSVIESRSVIDN